jgi:Domain of unknown function (DUF4326)
MKPTNQQPDGPSAEAVTAEESPKRIQIKSWYEIAKLPADVFYVGRGPKGYLGPKYPWGNPFKIGRDGTREQVLDKYEDYLAARPELKERIAREFCGKDLACWCDLDERCHADILLRIANPHP